MEPWLVVAIGCTIVFGGISFLLCWAFDKVCDWFGARKAARYEAIVRKSEPAAAAWMELEAAAKKFLRELGEREITLKFTL